MHPTSFPAGHVPQRARASSDVKQCYATMRSNTPFEAKNAPLITNQYGFITICNEEFFEAKKRTNGYESLRFHYDL